MIKSIVLPQYFKTDYLIIGDDKDLIDNLSKINILVGENNSGKSLLLRTLFKLTHFEYSLK
ncbi:hypothetical protein BSK55_29105, partial [Paenibacillus odorifer]